jgi:hypothetical protein
MSQTSFAKQQYIKLGITETILPRVEKRAKKLGHANLQDYIRWLITNDVEGLFYPTIDEKKIRKDIEEAERSLRSGNAKIVSSPGEVEEDLSQI